MILKIRYKAVIIYSLLRDDKAYFSLELMHNVSPQLSLSLHPSGWSFFMGIKKALVLGEL